MSRIKTILETDPSGNRIHYITHEGEEVWKQYNAEGYCTYCKSIDVATRNLIEEFTKSYNKRGNVLNYKHSDGTFEEYVYSELNNILVYKTNNHEQYSEYNENRQCIHRLTINGVDRDEQWWTYDENCQIVMWRDDRGNVNRYRNGKKIKSDTKKDWGLEPNPIFA